MKDFIRAQFCPHKTLAQLVADRNVIRLLMLAGVAFVMCI